MSGNAESCAASVRPAGPQPTIRTSTSSEPARTGPTQNPLGGIGDIGVARLETVQMELHGDDASGCPEKRGDIRRMG